MGRIHLDAELAEEYRQLFQSCQILPVHTREIDQLVTDIVSDQIRYEALAQTLALPWQVLSVIHYAATERSFDSHLHNGDPLSERTVHQPDGRPLDGAPPFSWEQSAVDYFRLHNFEQWQDWSLAGMLYKLESLDTWAYRLRQPPCPSPFLWCGSQHYQGGKFITDELWSDEASYTQYGVAVLLRRMAELDFVQFEPPAVTPFVRYSASAKSTPQGVVLQEFLNQLDGVYLRVDGWAGPRTSAAVRRLTGYYLAGDPRNIEQPLPEH